MDADRPMLIRGARSGDASAIARCVDAAYRGYVAAMGRTPAPMLDDYAVLIADGRVSVAVDGDRLLGLIVMWPEPDHLYVDNIAVDPDGQGAGVGSRLLQLADEAARAAGRDEIRLYTNEAMTSNVDFYPRRGFVETHRAVEHGYRRIYYSRAVPPRPDDGQLSVAAVVRRDSFRRSLRFDVAPGEVLGLEGHIGTGKTTALQLVAGRLGAEEGRVSLGRDVWDEPATSILKADRPVTMLSQRYQDDLPEDRSGLETIDDINRRLNPGRPADPTEVLAGLGVPDHVVERLPWTWSGAEAQRIALAGAVIPRPAVVLLDEPFGALDKRTGAAVRSWLTDWLDGFGGVAVVASTNADHLDPLADRIVSLDR